MLFCSKEFLYFFLLVFVLYWTIPWHRLRVYLLLGSSFYFYACWDVRLGLLIAFSASVDYFLARGMEAVTRPRVRKFLLGISVVGNLGLLCYFKYLNFFLQSLEQALQAAGTSVSMPVLEVILPIGISFYTFEAVSYSVDVYWRRVKAEQNLAHFLLFITFFPHLVAGPIVRGRDFLYQVRRHKRWNCWRMQVGVGYIVLGLFKKMGIGDRMALFADPVFADPGSFGTGATWIASIAYAIQIYCDFSGYSDIALGTAHLLGYRLAQNFNMPYLAANVSDFWRRWHISLSTWLRDYVYIPLGGSRGLACPACQGRRTDRNFLITMGLGGFWHGAGWTFFLWGLLHGLFLVVHRRFRGFCEQRPGLTGVLQTAPGTAFRMGLTFLCVMVAWIVFRAQTMDGAWTMIERLFVLHEGAALPMPVTSFFVLTALVLGAHLLAGSGIWQRINDRAPAPAVGFGYAVVVIVALVLALDLTKPFIYFQF